MAIDANKLDSTFRLVIDEVAATSELVLRLVVVALVKVELDEVRFVFEILVAARFVDVELEIVALVEFSVDRVADATARVAKLSSVVVEGIPFSV